MDTHLTRTFGRLGRIEVTKGRKSDRLVLIQLEALRSLGGRYGSDCESCF